jgi:cytochrome c biogenesis protein CcmG, thiol:disulfide interchange protein DsbE
MSARMIPGKWIGWNARSLLRTALCCAALLLISTTETVWGQHDHHAGAVVGSPAIPFDLKSLEGKSVGLAIFRGKPLVLNFFASWCDPCREEMPLINELTAKGVQNGYSMLGIAVEDSRSAVTEFVKESKLVFPVALDLNSTVRRAYRIFGPPATFFIDGQGIIRDIVLGPITPERAREAMKKVSAQQGVDPK